MRFSRLRLTGFKSFVDPTELLIADGLTGVVGPNGCGKSNLLEALRWVMGENRAKAMRGSGMEDVIFAGTASRPARNFAEVSLTLDNSDRLAPSGFNDLDQIDVIRRITRDAGSAYKANGKDVRARDVQMLFADASTGAHSPALVRQGQIAELINAKPTARRRILEEAAGISGLYQRRHEAELKLNGSETNLARVEDVLEQLSQQLAQLERQARQARRYREIAADLRNAEGLLLYRRWSEADEAAKAAASELTDRTRIAAKAETAARAASKDREGREASLPPVREEETVASAVLQRLIVEREALSDESRRAEASIASLARAIEQMAHDIDRETALNADADATIANLRKEAAEIAESSADHLDQLAAASEAARAAATILQEREAHLAEQTEDMARLSGRYQSAQRLCDDATRVLKRNEEEAAKAHGARDEARATSASASQNLEDAKQTLTGATEASEQAEAALAAADLARNDAQGREMEARAALSQAEGELSALSAEADALSRLVQRDTAESGQLIDNVTVAPGFEKALGAALADDLKASEIEPGAHASGWAILPRYETNQALPSGVEPLSSHVGGIAALERRLSQVGVVSLADGAKLQAALRPGQRLVTPEGDLWRWDGFQLAAEDAPSSAALRLSQLNRLEELKQGLEQANARAAGARSAHDILSRELAEQTEADRAARDARKDADRRLADAARDVSKAEAELSIAQGRVENLQLAANRHEDEALLARESLKEAETSLKELPDLDAARAEVEDIRLTVEAARMTMLAKRSAHDEMRRDGEAREKRAVAIEAELATWTERLETAEKRSAELTARKAAAEAEHAQALAIPAELETKRDDLSRAITEAEARKAAAADALSGAEAGLRSAVTAEREAERAASEARESRAGSEARLEAARDAVDAAAMRIREEMEVAAKDLLARLEDVPEPMPAADRLEADVNRLKRQRDALGAVNLRAEEDAREVEVEFATLKQESEDLQQAINKLRAGIAALNKEGRERLLTAFEQVNENFAMLFRHLFGGGEARLVMVESDDPLEAGLEIMCQPPGKKLSTLSLLSGGEQTLTALALIFAVFLANPAPICVLDEVDAPLDDANVTRFCDLLDEMTRRTETRFLIITHHAVTMARMDRLFGVTMGELGVSQLVSVDLSRAEQLVA